MLRCIVLFCLLLAISAKEQTTDEILDDIGIELDPKCVKQNIQNYEDLKDDFKICREPSIQKLIIAEAASHKTTGVKFADYICNKKKNEDSCQEIVKDRVEPCLSSGEKKVLDIGNKAHDKVMEYLCKDNGIAIKNMWQMNFKSCSEDVINTKDCESLEETDEDLNDEEDYFKAENCKSNRDELNCWLDKLDKCEDKTARTFMDSVTRVYFKATPCKQEFDDDGDDDTSEEGVESTKPTKTDPTPTKNASAIYQKYNIISLILFMLFTCIKARVIFFD